jgi:hypothetical protein
MAGSYFPGIGKYWAEIFQTLETAGSYWQNNERQNDPLKWNLLIVIPQLLNKKAGL